MLLWCREQQIRCRLSVIRNPLLETSGLPQHSGDLAESHVCSDQDDFSWKGLLSATIFRTARPNS
jgi:hypothetical protein